MVIRTCGASRSPARQDGRGTAMKQRSANPHEGCVPVQPQGRAGRSTAALADAWLGAFTNIFPKKDATSWTR